MTDSATPAATRGCADALDLAGLEDAELRAHLPEMLREITQRLSTRGVIALLREIGGSRIQIPTKPNASSRLARILSSQDFNALCAWRGGEEIHVARGTALWRWVRAQKVVALRAAGVPGSAVAKQLGIGERTVWEIWRRHRREPSATNGKNVPQNDHMMERIKR